jgi:type IV secretory pathway VirB9-like protein
VHPAKAGIRSNLNLITDKGNIYSFTLEDVSNENADPDLKVIVQPADSSSIAASTGPAQFVPVSQVSAVQDQLQALQSRIVQTIDQYKDSYRGQLKFDYRYKQNEAPFNIASIFHDDRFTYIKSDAQEKFTLYEVRDGAPNLINYDLKEGTYVIPKILDRGYVEIGKKRMDFERKQGQ